MKTAQVVTNRRTKRVELTDESLSCPLCNELYDDIERVAKCLPCLHSFCKKCLGHHAGKRPTFNCPKCRRNVTLPGATVHSLPNDYIVENLKELKGVVEFGTVPCGNCDERNEAMSYCHECECFVCMACIRGHQRMRSLRHHQISTMAELHEKKYNPIMHQQQVRCNKHKKQELILYCRESKCKVPVCATCGLVDHRGHHLIDMTEGFEEVVGDIRQLSTKLANRNKKLGRRNASVEKVKEGLTEQFNLKGIEVRDHFQKLHDQLAAQRSHANRQLQKLYDSEMDRLTENTKAMESLSDQMTSACEFADRACDMSYPAQLLTAQHQLVERMQELKITKVPDGGAVNVDYQFTKKHHAAMVLFEESLQYMCHVDWCTTRTEDEEPMGPTTLNKH